MPKSNQGYVEHPRFGAKPRFTGLDPDLGSMNVSLHYRLCRYSAPVLGVFRQNGWAVPKVGRNGPYLVPGTAVAADLTRQTPATIPVTHYYDEHKTCIDCHRPFLFFAEEQQHWYEELHFPIDADCVRCHPCRHRLQLAKLAKLKYDELVANKELTADEQVSLAFYRLARVQAGCFHSRQLDHVRAFLNRFPDHPQAPGLRQALDAMNHKDDAAGQSGGPSSK